ncbi:PAS domain-containing protein [Archangium violaceum]|uniref:PAS domain-containing protein n=1 Tax=Archangium violaceum TaxID=83451 RepID=UPI002B2A0C20|nr:PAS domain-containing protein [Archangium gephyra]
MSIPLFNPENAPEAAANIAERKRAEESLQESNEQLRLAQEAGGIGLFTVEISTDLMTVTPEFCRLYGLEPVDVMPVSAIEPLVHPEDRQIASTSESRALGLARTTVDYRIHRQDTGEPRWISRRAEFLRDAEGRPVRLRGVVQDVTQRKQAEDALRQANERLQLALNAGAVIGTWVWDIPADRFTADERFARSFSIDPEQAAQGLPLSVVAESIHPEDSARILALVARAGETGGSYRAEYRVRQLDGSYLWIEANGHCELTADGKPLRFPGVLLNIHERKKAELRQSALVELGDRLRELSDTDRIASTAMDIVGRLFGVSRAGYCTFDTARGLFQVERDWVSGPGVASVAGPHGFTDYGHHEHLGRGETIIIPDVEQDPRTAATSGKLLALGIRALLNVPLMEHGRLSAALFLHDTVVRHWSPEECEFIRDVADRIWTACARIKVMEELRRANELLEQRVEQRTRERDRLWNVSQDLLLVADMEGRFLSVNPAWTTQLGWSEEELLGKTSAWLEHPDDREKTRAEVTNLAAGNRTLRFENAFRHRNGTYRRLSWTAVPVHEDGVLYAFARDITEQRHIEEQLHQAQKMEAVGQLTGGVAHDFNNLLQVISGNLQLLQRDTAGNARAQSRLRAAVGAVERGARLASHLLAFARRQPLQPLVFNVGRLVRGMDDMLRRPLGESIEVEALIPGDLWNTFADPNQLENVLLNLAINARDAMPEGGTLKIEARNARLDEDTARLNPEVLPGEYVLLAVTDTGCGMPPEVLERAFEPFFTTKPEGRGTGLGLSMVYGFVKQSGGHIQISSQMGRGTTIELYLPRALRDEETAPAEASTGPIEGGSETILVVEDNPEVRATVVEMLTELGYRVLKAADGQSALAILQSGISVDLLFTDVVMPGPIRGAELARRARELLPELEVLFTSGYTEDAIATGGRLDPGVQLLSKPHRREDMARKVRQLLDNRARKPASRTAKESARRQRVLLVEDDEDIRASACELLGLLGFDVLAVASAEEARKALEAGVFGVLFTDVTLPGSSGVELAREAVRHRPGMGIIIASGLGNAVFGGSAERLEGAVMLPKPYALPQLQRALEQVERRS